MKPVLALGVALMMALGASIASANFHLYKIEQIYSNATGTVQFVVLNTNIDGEHVWSGHYLKATGPAQINNYVFPTSLPLSDTAHRRVLVATEGFAALGLVTPDYVVPDGFLPIGGGTVDFAGVNQVTYEGLPTDGVHAIDANGVPIPNVATNFLGDSASVSPSPPPPAALSFQGIWWNAPAESESGWGINFAHQGDVIFAAWYTYDANGRAWWLTMLAEKTGPNTYAGKLYENRGPALNVQPFNKDLVQQFAVGDATLTFADGEHGTFRYTVNGTTQTKSLVRFAFGAMPTCTWGAQANLALATNYQDMWWASPPPGAESGWGATLTHQGDAIFVAWFTYDLDGKPLWLTATVRKGAPGVYSGDINRTTGPAFSATLWDKNTVAATKIGDLTITFANGNHASFHYTLTLGGVAIDQTKTIERFVFLAPGTACH